MIYLVLAAALAGQYPTPQAPMYGAPAPQYAAPIPQTFSVPVQYSAPQVQLLGAGAVIPPGPFGLMLGHIGRKLEMHSWPRVQPMVAAPATMQTVYLQMSAPQVMQAVYSVPAPTYAAPPPAQYGAPAPPQKNPPTQYQAPQTTGAPGSSTYGSPQAQQAPPNPYGASKPNPASEAAPPVPKA